MNRDKTPDLDATVEDLSLALAEAGYVSRAVVRESAVGAKVSLFLVGAEFAKAHQDIVGSLPLNTEFLSSVEEELKRGPYRKKHERPDPSKPADAEVNRQMRSSDAFSVRIDPDVIALAKEFKKTSGRTMREIVEEALQAYIASQDYDGPD